MATNTINITFTVPQLAAMIAAAASANTNFPFAINLTVTERNSTPNIENVRYPYVERSVDFHAPANPSLVSGFAYTLTEATTDWNVIKQIDQLLPLFRVIVEKLEDTRQLAASELWAWFLEFYASAQRAAANNFPGADTIVNDLSPLFANQGAQTPPAPATP